MEAVPPHDDRVADFTELRVYRGALDVSMEIFRLTLSFPQAERYALVDQIRRSSRSVCANLAEAWRKRRYAAAFVAKLNDAQAEADETKVWLDIAERCQYLSPSVVQGLKSRYDIIIRQLVTMERRPDLWSMSS